RRGESMIPGWQTLRFREFRRNWGKALAVRSECERCHGPVSEPMTHCPWCGDTRDHHHGPATAPRSCERCGRGMKLDWHYCAYCWGPGVEVVSSREYPDVRYSAKCANPRCTRR